MEPLITAKASGDSSKAERAEFAAFVRAGGEVRDDGLEERIASAFRLFFVHQGTCLVAIGSLKVPQHSYRARVEHSSGVALPSATYPYELGWVFTLPSARRQGHARRVVQVALNAAQGRGVFATTRTDNEGMEAVLREFGFTATGTAYPGRGNYQLKVFVRGVPSGTASA